MAALALVVGAAAASYEVRTTVDPSAGPAAIMALPYEPHLLIVGYSGPAARLIDEIEARTQLRVSISSHPELTPGEQLLALPGGITPPQAAAETHRCPVSPARCRTTSRTSPGSSSPTIPAAPT